LIDRSLHVGGVLRIRDDIMARALPVARRRRAVR
jgi:hypothetical protein